MSRVVVYSFASDPGEDEGIPFQVQISVRSEDAIEIDDYWIHCALLEALGMAALSMQERIEGKR